MKFRMIASLVVILAIILAYILSQTQGSSSDDTESKSTSDGIRLN